LTACGSCVNLRQKITSTKLLFRIFGENSNKDQAEQLLQTAVGSSSLFP
tara:strand:- start:279622 stop:279768 length:147 start_codon:yes stop_codon:yes gene_type:complete